MSLTVPTQQGEPDFSGFSHPPKSWTNARYHNDGTVTLTVTDTSWPPSTSKADVWRRATDAEAEAIDALLRDPPPYLGMSPVKLRRLWDDATSIDHTDPLFYTIRAIAVQNFGKSRAEELLKPSGGD